MALDIVLKKELANEINSLFITPGIIVSDILDKTQQERIIGYQMALNQIAIWAGLYKKGELYYAPLDRPTANNTP